MIQDDNKTLWCGNVPEQATEELLYELFLQAGPLEKVRIAKDKDGRQRNYAFITYCHEVSVPYALSLFRSTALFHKTLSLQGRGRTALLPPPIRCFGPEVNIDFQSQGNVTQEFANMMEDLKNEEYHVPLRSAPEPTNQDQLVLASLQGNWSHRHHPYRSDKLQGRSDDYRQRDNHSDNYKSNSRKHSNWRERRNNKKSYGYRRE